mmetsp:Transcript_17224/g.37388  ORF Transcript_17224/g.37388 Transcript_17224/m.37388 type:complete len:172 (+) Transcript_17224:1284-1799(+)
MSTSDAEWPDPNTSPVSPLIMGFECIRGIFASDGRPCLNMGSINIPLSEVIRACSHRSMKFFATSPAASPLTQTTQYKTRMHTKCVKNNSSPSTIVQNNNRLTCHILPQRTSRFPAIFRQINLRRLPILANALLETLPVEGQLEAGMNRRVGIEERVGRKVPPRDRPIYST